MATIDELLNDAAYDDVNEVIHVDPVMRQLLLPSTELILGVEGDEKAECKYFSMPRVVGNNVDVSECSLRVVYTNAAGTEDYFKVEQCVFNEDAVVFCWELSRKVTAAAGQVEFSVCVCKSVDNIINTEWNTTNAYGKVLPGHKRLDGSDEDVTTHDIVAMAEAAAQRAEAAADRAESGGSGETGADGGYYTPKVSQPSTNTMLVEHIPSKAGMPAVEPATINLPVGSDSSHNANKALTFTGAVSATYNGTKEVTVNIPSSTGGSAKSVYYIATDYGISADVEDNTPALQTMVDTISEAGGGIIFFPVGTYKFKKAATKYAVLMKSNVSIVGENIENTILKQSEAVPYSLFYFMGSADSPITGCHFSDFTVDAYDTGDTNEVYGKAFFFQYVKNCAFDNLMLKGTVATALGIDYLDNVSIRNINCIDCGRTYAGGNTGTSGIGIGTGGWEHENFTITDCICVGSGQYGIFIENQYNQGWGGNTAYAKGCVISGCVTRNGLNKGIGIRGGQNVTIANCESYENASNGIYLDSLCKRVNIKTCSFNDNGSDGINVSCNSGSSDVVFEANTSCGNEGYGIGVYAGADGLAFIGNYTRANTNKGFYITEANLSSFVCISNAFIDGLSNKGTFSGVTKYNELLEVSSETGEDSSGNYDANTIKITLSEMNNNKMLSNGTFEEGTANSTDYIAIPEGCTSFTVTRNAEASNQFRIGQYDADKTPTSTGIQLDDTSPRTCTVEENAIYVVVSVTNGGSYGFSYFEIEWLYDAIEDSSSEVLTADIDGVTYNLSASKGYPYKTILVLGDTYYLYYSANPFCVNASNYRECFVDTAYRAPQDGKTFNANSLMTYSASNGTLVEEPYYTTTGGTRTINSYVWTNHDLYYVGTETVAVPASITTE